MPRTGLLRTFIAVPFDVEDRVMQRSRRVDVATTIVAAALALAACGGGAASTPGTSAATANTTTGATLAGNPLVGAWTTAVTKQDLEGGGITDPAARNENSGRFTWTFGPDGTWTAVQESLDGSPINNPIFRGTFTVDGSSLVMTTVFPAEYRDEGLHYTWSIAGDALTLDVLDPPDPILPLVVESHPWIRAS
jgi:hypothetical protein